MKKTTQLKSRLLRLSSAAVLLSIACVALGCLVVSWDSPMQGENENARRVMSQDIRGARHVESCGGNELVLRSNQGTISYTFDAAGRSLTRATRLKSEKLLSHVDAFSFSLLGPDPNCANGALVPTSASKAKAVACGWSCSWKLAGAKLDSDQIRLAAILLRNR